MAGRRASGLRVCAVVASWPAVSMCKVDRLPENVFSPTENPGTGDVASPGASDMQSGKGDGLSSPVDAGTDVAKSAGDAVSPPKDSTMTAPAPGCTASSDQQYLASLANDEAEVQKLSDSLASCLFGGCVSKGSDAEGATCIAKCVLSKGHALTEACAACYGGFSYCIAKYCLSPCTPGASPDCQKCVNEKGCVAARDNCMSGK